LPGVLENVNNLLGGCFQVQRLAIGEQVIVGGLSDQLGEPLTEFLLQEANNLTNALKGKPTVAELTNDSDLREIR
jgi:hypothetical protein